MIKVAIMGKQNSGKNTLANLIQAETERQFHHSDATLWTTKLMAFADPIKEMGMAMFPGSDRQGWYGPSRLRSSIIPNAYKNEQPLTYRQVLLDLGKQGREYNENLWVENLATRFYELARQTMPPNLVVITDVRFPNEFDYLISKQFHMVRLYRPFGNNNSQEVSEVSQDILNDEQFHSVLYNSGTLDDLRQRVSEMIADLPTV